LTPRLAQVTGMPAQVTGMALLAAARQNRSKKRQTFKHRLSQKIFVPSENPAAFQN